MNSQDSPRVPSAVEGAASGGNVDSRRNRAFKGSSERLALVFVWLVMIAAFSFLEPDTFFSRRNFQIILGSQAVLLVLALGVVVALAVGEFDLSGAAVLGFATHVGAHLNTQQGLPIVAAVAIVLLVGIAVGIVNAFIVIRLGVPSIIVSLGVATLLSGLRQFITGNEVSGGVSAGLVAFTNTKLLGLPLLFYYGLLLCIATWYVLQYTPVGRHIYFIGQGPEVARLAGINVDQIRFGALVSAAAISALAGVFLLGRLGSATPGSGTTLLLPAYAAAFLGATAIVPGRFNAWGTFVAVYFLVTGSNGLLLAGFRSWVQEVFNGAALLIAVVLARVLSPGQRVRGH